jgi:hypothetical protein
VIFGWFPYWKWIHQIQTDNNPAIQCQIQLYWVVVARISFVHAPSLSFDIVDKWNINNQSSKSFVRPGHVMVFLIVFSVPYEVNIHDTRTVLFVSMIEECRSCICNKADHFLQYVVLSNDVRLITFLVIP